MPVNRGGRGGEERKRMVKKVGQEEDEEGER